MRENPLFVIVSLAALAFYFFCDQVAGMMLAAVNVVPGGTPKLCVGKDIREQKRRQAMD